VVDLKTDRGEVVGLGRLKIPKIPHIGFDCEIPLLSFVVIKGGSKDYIATCIHMQMDGYGSTISEACDDMAESVFDHIYENFRNPDLRESAWDCLAESFRSNPRSNLLWDKYHDLQIELAKKNITVDKDASLWRKIESLQSRVKELERKLVERELELSEKDNFVNTLLNSLICEKHQYGRYNVSEFIVDFETRGVS